MLVLVKISRPFRMKKNQSDYKFSTIRSVYFKMSKKYSNLCVANELKKNTVDGLITHFSLFVSGNNGTFSAVRFHTVTTWPIFSRLETIPLPISPRPKNPIL